MAERCPKILLLRHGQTEWSLSGRHTGRTDIPLTAEGEAEALALAPVVAEQSFELVLSSPLQRARQTCELAGLAGQAQLRDDLMEWDYGDYEGLTSAQIHGRDAAWDLWRDGCPGGESPADVAERCDRIVAELETFSERSDGAVAVFAHGHILRVLAARWCELDVAAGARLALSTATISQLGHEHERRVICGWNAPPHGL